TDAFDAAWNTTASIGKVEFSKGVLRCGEYATLRKVDDATHKRTRVLFVLGYDGCRCRLMEMGEKMAEIAGESGWQGKAGKMVEQCICTVILNVEVTG
nr:hypothetical protein [Tanacetum cinerariifolium]